MSKQEELTKSIDELIDQVFAEDTQVEEVEKSIDIAGDSKKTADEAVSGAPKAQKDEARGAGRPKQISDVPQSDQDGRRESDYDGSISEDAKEKDQEEADQVKEMNQIKAKGGDDAKKPKSAPFKKSLSEEEYEEYQALKKAKEEAEAEEMKKAESEKQETLIKAVVESTLQKAKAIYEEKIETLEKNLKESTDMIKAMANAPKTAKTITGIEELNKSQEAVKNNGPEVLTKSELADLAIEAFEKGVISEDEAIEIDNNGYIYDKNARRAFEQYVEKKFS